MREKTNIASFLGGFRKADLLSIADVFGKEIASGRRKAEIVAEFSVYLTGSADRWLNLMPERDLMLLSSLVETGPDCPLILRVPDYPTVVEMAGIVESHCEEEDQYESYWITQEIYNAVAPHIGAAIRRGRTSGRFDIERVLLGYLNLFGILPLNTFLEYIGDYMEAHPDLDSDKLTDFIVRNPALKLYRFEDGETSWLASPCVENGYDLMKSLAEADIPYEFHPFTEEDARSAGSGAPYFTYGLDTEEGRALEEMLLRLGYDGDALRWEEHEIWMCAQNPDIYIALFDSVTRKSDTILSQEAYDACIETVASYADSLPKWALFGYSSNETGLMKARFYSEQEDVSDDEHPHWEMPHPTISEGYSDVIETNEALDSILAMMPKGFPFGMAIPHVAPDDPCPCGSGLRYGNCHGKLKN